MLERLQKIWPNLLLGLLIVYVGLLGFATVDEILGWGLITPYFK